MTLNQFFLGLATVIISNVCVYLVARRTSSGQIDTSNAADLWKESGDIRRELSMQAQFWRDQWQATQSKLDEANKRIAMLEEQRGARG